MDQKEVEFGTITQISAQIKERLIFDEFENIIKEGLRRNAEAQGYKETQAPQVFWSEQAWKIEGNEEDGFFKVPCDLSDKGAFFEVGAKMKVVKK